MRIEGRSNQLLSLLVVASWLLLLGLAMAHDDNAGHLTESAASSSYEPHVRTKRGIFWDFIQKMVTTKNLIVDQYTDTRNTFNDIYNQINEQFSDPAQSKPTGVPRVTKPTTKQADSSEESDQNTTTTTEYSITRYELGRILGRNFRGLQRVAQQEFKDALNATKYNLQGYKAEADQQFANSLALEKKNKLKNFKG